MEKKLDLLDIQQAAEFLNIGEATLRRWTNSGKLACLRVGARKERRFRREDLMGLLTNEPSAKGTTGQNLESSIQPTTINIAGLAVPIGTHICSFYSNRINRIKLAIGFLADGLTQDCACYLLAAPKVGQEFIAQLKRQNISVQKTLDSGQLVILPYRKTADEQIDFLETSFRKTMSKGFHSIRVAGDVSEGPIVSANPIVEVLAYEKEYEERLAQRFPLVTLCQYNACKHSGADLLEILKLHPNMFRFPPGRLLS